MTDIIKIPELLCPAGDMDCLRAAVSFGADAVYLAGEEFGMRTASDNFSADGLKQAVDFAHKNGVKVHITCNVLPHNDEFARLPLFLETVASSGADAVIASDLGTMQLVKKYVPNAELHASVQSGIVNYATAEFLYNMGAKRVVLARELSLEEIAEIRAKTPKEMEIETFIHGAMCVSYSARCLLSDYMTGRDANRGDCAQSCRWSYSLVEQKRPGELYDITETDRGTYILNSNDLCMAEHLDKVANAGVDCIKIEGRAKSEYYVAVTANAYRGALDELKANPETFVVPAWVRDELTKISHREYSTGFYFGKPHISHTYPSAGYVREYAVAAVVDSYEDGFIICTMKNRFSVGDELDCLEAGNKPFTFKAAKIIDEKGESVDVANHPMMKYKIEFNRPIKKGSMLRIKI